MITRTIAIACAIAATLASVPVHAEKLVITQYGRIAASLPWAVALKKGYLKEGPLNVDEIISGAGGGTSLRSMLASEIHFAEISTTAVIPAVKQGFDLRIVMSASNHIGELAWQVKPDSGINSLKDMVGKKIAFTSPRSTTEMVLRTYLKREGMDKQVEAVTVGGLGPALTALAQGAVASAPLNDPAMTLSPEKSKVLFWAKDVYPHFTWSVGVVTREYAEKNPQKVRALVQAHRKAVQFMKANRAETALIYAQIWEVDRGLAEKLLPKYYDWGHWAEGDFSKDGLQAVMQGMMDVGEIDTPIDWAKLIDQNFLDPDLRRPL